MKDPQKEVLRIAALARLRLEASDVEKISKQFSSLIEHFEKIQALDTKGVEPLVYPFETANVLRADQERNAENNIDKEALLRNAPERIADFYKVPKVIEG